MSEFEHQPNRPRSSTSITLELIPREYKALQLLAIKFGQGDQEYLKRLVVRISRNRFPLQELSDDSLLEELDSNEPNPLEKFQVQPPLVYPVEVDLGAGLMEKLAFDAIVRRFSSPKKMIEPFIAIEMIRDAGPREREELIRVHLDES